MQNPVAIEGALSAIAFFLTPILAKVGIDADGTTKILAFIGTAIAAAAGAWRIWIARTKVTPVANPRDNQGRELVPRTQ